MLAIIDTSGSFSIQFCENSESLKLIGGCECPYHPQVSITAGLYCNFYILHFAMYKMHHFQLLLVLLESESYTWQY